jgi:hypothetical protein
MLYDCSMKQGARDSHQRIAFVHLFGGSTSFAEQQEIQVVPTGKWDHPVYGEMEIDSVAAAELVKNFEDKVRLKMRSLALRVSASSPAPSQVLPAGLRDRVDRWVGKGALAPCPPPFGRSMQRWQTVGTLRFTHPTGFYGRRQDRKSMRSEHAGR